ncbi:MAG: formate--tetrahydrofolate ligase [Thermotogae bacterium]|nr:formate--tetrahydrofolate ligase [Thermotogota bacterium]
MDDALVVKNTSLKPIVEVAKDLGLSSEDLHLYGPYIAKIPHKFARSLSNSDARLVLVTAMTPTPAGEGKTTVSIGLSMALNRLGVKSVVVLREPSLGPVMGIKGGATGGGHSQVLPAEEINLHFTGDIHAVTSAHNLLSAAIDLALKFGTVELDPLRIVWPRAMDMNDRALRKIVIGLGGRVNGYPREESFIITAASEVMAILCLAKDLDDLKGRLGRIVVGYSRDGTPVTAEHMGVHEAMAVLLKRALDPNLVQTIEHTPALVHGGPFANVAHGTSSLVAIKSGLNLSEVTVVEAGFGADLGAEKFINFVSRVGGFNVNAVVLVASIRALKYHGGKRKESLREEDVEALQKGFQNLLVHHENLKKFNLPVVVALNRFENDTEKEINRFFELCRAHNMRASLVEAWGKGSEGAEELARTVMDVMVTDPDIVRTYEMDEHVTDKLSKIAIELYRASGVDYSDKALRTLKMLEKCGYAHLPVIVAKTQYSLSDDPKKLNVPGVHRITVQDFKVAAGAGFVVAEVGNILLMPGMPKDSNAMKIRMDSEGNIHGLI